MTEMSLNSDVSHLQQPQQTTHKTRIHTYTIWNYHLFYFIVFLCLLEKGETACYNSINLSCKLCFSQDNSEVQSCVYLKDANNNNCRSICCNYSYSGVSVPSNCNSTGGSSISISTIIIIVVFSIPVVICVILLIHSCIVGMNRTPAQAARPQREPRNGQSAINLQLFNMDQSFPYHIDRKQVCSICLESECHIMTFCGHTYHSPCLRAWVKKKESCPLCVSLQFNPLGIFCTICGKSMKVNVMHRKMQSARKIQWEEASKAKCNNCVNGDDQQEIQISLGEEQIKRYQKSVVVDKRQIIPAESQQRITKRQTKDNNFT